LEDVPAAPPWTLDALAELAQRVGVSQAAFAADVPGQAWLARGWLREYLRLHDVLDADADGLLARLDALPATFCHLDLHPGNVLGEDGSVVIDWAHCGIAALGSDPGVLVADGVADEVFPPELADEATEAVLEAYLAGLHAGGWAGDDADIRWAMLRGTALRLSWLPATKPSWVATHELLGRWASLRT
jgi:Ser/Thr protein kinase RdoA (MazF antagonist)